MDVTALRPDASEPATRAPRFLRPPPGAEPTPPQEAPQLAKPSERWTPSSTLKLDLHAADVTARFEIHQPTSRVTVTMLDRNTGEVLREVPNRRVLEQIAALATATGLTVDLLS